ncbi:MAG: hypothetical protein U0Z75_07655 [Deinococcaceae bacterium]
MAYHNHPLLPISTLDEVIVIQQIPIPVLGGGPIETTNWGGGGNSGSSGPKNPCSSCSFTTQLLKIHTKNDPFSYQTTFLSSLYSFFGLFSVSTPFTASSLNIGNLGVTEINPDDIFYLPNI